MGSLRDPSYERAALAARSMCRAQRNPSIGKAISPYANARTTTPPQINAIAARCVTPSASPNA
jgi:hypothetical protein